METTTNRSYKNKTVKAANYTDAILVSETKEKMKGKPVVVSISISNPMVFSEIEKNATAILLNFGVQDQAIIETIAGKSEPSALLPMQMPANMNTIEKQSEDVPYDVQCYKDAEGSVYDFGFGLNWKGVIKDGRGLKFKK
jgi:beta-glucosidase